MYCLHPYGNNIHKTDGESDEIEAGEGRRPPVIVSISTSIPLTVGTEL